MNFYELTPAAIADVHHIGRESQARWGEAQAFAYLSDIQHSFQYIADRHDALPKRTRLTGTSRLRLHRVGHHYVVFIVLTQTVSL